jgi:hypothetical protein
MSNAMTELLHEIERRIEARRNKRLRKPLIFPGERRRAELPTWSQQKPYVPVTDHRLHESQL